MSRGFNNRKVKKVEKKLTGLRAAIQSAVDTANSIFQKAIEKVKAAKETLTKTAEDLLAQKPALTAEIKKIDVKLEELKQERQNVEGNFAVIENRQENPVRLRRG